MKQGTLVLSLDFELVWGVFDHIRLDEKVRYFDQTLQVIPQLLDCFEKNDLQATWATVGMLFNANWDEWMANQPEERPTYDNPNLDAYAYGERHRKSGLDRFFFAPELIKAITQTKGQELGTHTYSHYYCGEPGQTVGQFNADLAQAVHLARKLGVTMESLVFPRNQYHESYIAACGANGIRQVRTNPKVWYWEDPKAGLVAKVARTADAYLPFAGKSYPLAGVEAVGSGVRGQAASRFLRPLHANGILNALRLQRVVREMTAAAQNGEVYHLWWHPHNFGDSPQESMVALQGIVAAYKKLADGYGFVSRGMRGV